MSNIIKYEFTRIEPKLWGPNNSESHTPDSVCSCVIGLTATEYLSDGTTPTGETAYIDTIINVSDCPSLNDFSNTLSTVCNTTATNNNWKQTLDTEINSKKDVPYVPQSWNKPTINFNG